jgi:5-methylcytosine-specific restriction endonuclease McrA
VVQKKKWTPRVSTRGRRIFIPYEVFYDIEWDEADRFHFCKIKHARRRDAERCAKRTIRRIQKGQSAVVLTSVERPTLSTSRSRVERVPVPGLNDDVWRFMKEMYKNRCYYCDRGGIKLQREHRVPLARCGDNHLSNIVPACEPCNRRKGILTDDEFFKLLADEHEYLAATGTDGSLGPPSPPLPGQVDLDGKAVKVPLARRGARVELPQGMKWCRRCSRVLPVSAFGSHKGKKDGLTSRCRECNAEVQRERKAKARAMGSAAPESLHEE